MSNTESDFELMSKMLDKMKEQDTRISTNERRNSHVEQRVALLEKIVQANSEEIATLQMKARDESIRRELLEGKTNKELALKHNISSARISQIKKNS